MIEDPLWPFSFCCHVMKFYINQQELMLVLMNFHFYDILKNDTMLFLFYLCLVDYHYFYRLLDYVALIQKVIIGMKIVLTFVYAASFASIRAPLFFPFFRIVDQFAQFYVCPHIHLFFSVEAQMYISFSFCSPQSNYSRG